MIAFLQDLERGNKVVISFTLQGSQVLLLPHRIVPGLQVVRMEQACVGSLLQPSGA